jgi:hypothetical protein
VSASGDTSDSAQGDGALNQSERAELEKLRAEVGRLRAQPAARQPRKLGWRTPVASLLIVLGCILAPLSVLGVWTANQVSNTSTYVANVAPLARNPAIQNALTDKITMQITSHIHVVAYTNTAASALASHGLPRVATVLRSFAPSIAGAVSGFIHGQVHRLVTSPGFAHLWDRVNTVAHAQLVKALSGQGSSAITVQNGQVTIGLGPFIDEAKHGLAARGLTIVEKLPTINPTFPLFSAKYLVKAQTAYRVINDLKIVLPIAALLLLAAGVYVARSHRRALIGAGLGVATSMFVLAAGLLIARGIYLNSVPNSKLPADAAAALYDTLVRFIRTALRTLLVVGLVVAAGAFMTGPSVTAVRSRQTISGGLHWTRDKLELAGVRTGPVGRWTYAHRAALRIGAVVVAVLIFVFWGRPTPAVVIVLAALLLLVLGLIELIGKPPPEPAQPEAPVKGA